MDGPDKVQDQIWKETLQQSVCWYVDCLNEQDIKNTETTSNFSFLPAYNRHIPELNVIHLEALKKYILSFKEGILTFDDHNSMDLFIRETLGYDTEQSNYEKKKPTH